MQAKHHSRGQKFATFSFTALAAATLLATLLAAPARAEVATETATLGDFTVTLHIQPFLTEDDLSILRMVLTSKDALALFVPDPNGFAALAASPDDGFVNDGVPAASVVALGGLVDAQTALNNAVNGCQQVKQGAADCVVLLEIAPKK